MRMIAQGALARGERGGCVGERAHSTDDRLEPAFPHLIGVLELLGLQVDEGVDAECECPVPVGLPAGADDAVAGLARELCRGLDDALPGRQSLLVSFRSGALTAVIAAV
jgi:hypothetical protein